MKRAGCTVALSGLGADELFLGYGFMSRLGRFPPFGASLAAPLARMTSHAPLEDHRAQRAASIARTLGDVDATLAQQRRLYFDPQVEALLARPLRGHARPLRLDAVEAGADPMQRAAAFELRGYCAHMLLRDADQMSMAHGLELRVPMLDHRVVELVHRMPSEWKRPRRNENKPLLAEAVRDLVCESVTRRSKRGFGLDVAGWLRGPLRAEAESLLLRDGRLFEPAFVGALWRRFLSGDRHLTPRVWALVRLLRWLEANDVG